MRLGGLRMKFGFEIYSRVDGDGNREYTKFIIAKETPNEVLLEKIVFRNNIKRAQSWWFPKDQIKLTDWDIEIPDWLWEKRVLEENEMADITASVTGNWADTETWVVNPPEPTREDATHIKTGPAQAADAIVVDAAFTKSGSGVITPNVGGKNEI
jgi:hypothetical protein